ncbi:MAG: hypothetical protein ACNYPI_02490 [Arenicellales bacterium WSBS_2016_MAG_OTU3]
MTARFRTLVAGRGYEYGQAEALIEGFQAGFVLADKGCDADDFIEKISTGSAVAVIPGRKNRVNNESATK